MTSHVDTAVAECSTVVVQFKVLTESVHNLSSSSSSSSVLPLSSAPEGRGADGVDAMA
jgi:hypothetical protein